MFAQTIIVNPIQSTRIVKGVRPIVERIHDKVQFMLYQVALRWNCHQLMQRSFHVRGRQVPLCARCLGIFFGPFLFPLYLPHSHWWVSTLLIALCAIDGFTQIVGFRSSTNFLRFSTGAGFSLGACHFTIGLLSWLLNIIL